MDNVGEGVDHITMEVDNYANVMGKLIAAQSSGRFQDPDGVKLAIKPATN